MNPRPQNTPRGMEMLEAYAVRAVEYRDTYAALAHSV